MSKILVIAEKPSVARDIAQALGGFSKAEGGWLERGDALVSSAVGHLVTLHVPEAQTTGKDLDTLPVIPPRFGLQVLDRAKPQFNLLARLMKREDVTQVVNACDAGREGELIFRLIYEAAGCKKPIRRMWLQSMTADAIRQAYEGMRPGDEFNALADAAKCRSEADWLVGINGSRGITRLRERQKGAYEQMTAGRVQTPTLAIVVHRESEIRNFVPKDYWEVHATFAAQAGTYSGRWMRQGEKAGEGEDPDAAGARIFDKGQALAIVAMCDGVAPSSVTDESKTTSNAAPRLFDLTTLQREANKRFKFSAKRTLDIAQALYEKHKATTYPRTDATALPEDYIDTAKQVLGSLGSRAAFGEHAKRVLDSGWVRADKRIFDNSKISDHFAIIPTETAPSGLDPDEAKIYDLVVRRFIAVFHPAAQYSLTTRISVVAGETFKSTGKVLVDPGWRVVYGGQGDDDRTPALCAVQPGEPVQTRGVEAKGLQTKPAARFTEATLLAAMEGAGKLVDEDELRHAMSERGLGTPATRAATIEGLLSDQDGQGRAKEPYLRREGKEQHLVPTEKGMGLVTFLETNGVGSLTSPKMTGEWEQKLRLMEKGQYSRRAFMDEIAAMTRDMIDVIRRKASDMPVAPVAQLAVPCPKCGNPGVQAKVRTFECAAACGWKMWREIAKRDLSDAEAQELLQNGSIKPLDGFVSSKTNRKFSAGLKLGAESKVEFEFAEREPVPLGNSIGAPCPNCGSVVHVKWGEHPQFVCENGDFKLWRKVAGRDLSDDEARELLTNGSLGAVHGFISSKTKRPFSAGLRLTADNSKVEFVFEPR
ncbi:DNA topoisomerase 3 [Bordetella flabilis]|uniref:DNA topoisomerase n=1 Tax=Bordetella flabilis TaxID=463014 RepID=A0A193GMM5_9BORD|nr:DNA topoisomerase 3 [Bordetella flabilis]ANN80858.1 DNA topoisomerase [Bordetella flabilis]